MPTKAQLELEVEQWKNMYLKETSRRILAEDKIHFLTNLPPVAQFNAMAEAMAKMAHALRKTIELEKTGKVSNF